MITTWFSKVVSDHAEEGLTACLDLIFGRPEVPGTNGNHPGSWRVTSKNGAATALVSLEEGKVSVSSSSEEFAKGVFLMVEDQLNTVLIGSILGVGGKRYGL